MREISICYTTATYEVHTFKRSFIKRQTIGTSSDNELQTSGTTSSNEWQRATMNDNEWQRVGAFVQWMKTAQYTSKNGWLPSFQWQKEIHYYFKGWMAAIRVVK